MELIRKEAYDNLCKEALERINAFSAEELAKPEVDGIKKALEQVLVEEDAEKLAGYYARIDEFYTVNVGKGLEYLNGGYLLNGVVA